jgi:hypothetical protein
VIIFGTARNLIKAAISRGQEIYARRGRSVGRLLDGEQTEKKVRRREKQDYAAGQSDRQFAPFELEHHENNERASAGNAGPRNESVTIESAPLFARSTRVGLRIAMARKSDNIRGSPAVRTFAHRSRLEFRDET